jgi:hypothetical protein
VISGWLGLLDIKRDSNGLANKFCRVKSVLDTKANWLLAWLSVTSVTKEDSG